MTKTKKVVALMLAFLMIFSSASVLASAWDASVDDGSTLEISTKFFKEVDGQWVETEKVRPGDNVKARVYLGTDYYSNGSTLLFFYDKDFFTHAYSTSSPNALAVNPAISNVSGSFAADYDMSKKAADNGVDSAFLADNSAMYVTLVVNDGNNMMFNDSTWMFEFDFVVAGDADGEGDLFVKESTIQNTSNEDALVNVPKGPAGGNSLTAWPMWLWDATPVLDSQPVSTISSVTFNANGGEYEDGTDTYKVEDLIDAAIDASTIPAPSKTGYSFMGWIDAADTTPTYEEIIEIPAAIPENDLVLNAYWMENVTITFETGEGTPIAPHENVTPYADFADVTPPTRDGYTFVGWDVRGNMELPETYPAESTTYTAIWALNVTVSFNTDGGTEIAPIKGVEGEPFDASAVADPTKAGHNFIMWDPSLPEKFPEQDTTYNAIFETRTYRIWYYAVNAQGKTEASAVVQREYGSAVPTSIPTMKLPEGKEFASETWYTDAACTVALADGAVVTDNMKLYKKTQYATYDAIFMVDGEEYRRVPTVYGEEIAIPENPAKAGYVFDGWSPAAQILGEPNDMIFKAAWREAENEVIYIKDGSEYETYKIETGELFDVPADPYKEGYTFKGWTDVEGGTTAVELPETMPAVASLTYYAIFEINEYTITFDTDEGTAVDSITEDFGTAITAPADPTKTGYTFKGWALTKGAAEADKVALPATMPAKDQTYYAIWVINEYTITFVDTGDVAYEAITQDYNTAIEEVADPVKTGYTFKGWDTEIPATMPAKDMTITATWEANSYKATFLADGGVFEETGNATYEKNFAFDSNIVAPKDPTKTGYTFGGWTPAVGKMDSVDGKTFTAIWNANGNTAYTVSIYTMDTEGNYGEPEVLDFTAATDSPVSYAPEAKNGFALDDENNVLSDTVAPDGSTNLVVYYIRNQYTFKTVADGKETTETYYFDEAVTAPAAPSKTGHTFDGWDGEVPSKMPANDVTLTAKWTVNPYTVTWIIDGAEKEETYNYGATIVAPKASKTGYSFKGWTPAFVEGTAMPAENLEFTAVFEAEFYDATFLADGGVFEENGKDTYVVSTAYDSEIVAPKNPTKTGFVFSGWTPATGMDKMDTVGGETYTATWSNAKNTPYTVNVYTMGTDGVYGVADVKNLTGETNTTAKYEPVITDGFKINASSVLEGNIEPDGSLVLNVYIDRISYTFKAVSNGETMAEETVLYGAKTPAVADPENKVGYTFVEWNPEIPATMPAGDLTVEAVFEANSDTEYKVVVNYTDLATGAHAEEFYYAGTSDNAIAIVDEIPDPAADNTDYVLMSDLAVANYVLDTTADNDLTGTVAADGTTVLNLYYVAVKYTATFNAVDGDYVAKFEDGDTSKAVELPYNSLVKANAPSDPVREGYTFTGWNGLNDATRLTGNRAFTPSWDANAYEITWVLDGKETTEEVDCDALIVKKTAPVKTGWTFQYWVDAEGNQTEIPDTMPANDLYFETYYTINPHTVTWINDGATETDNYVYGDTIVVDTPVKDGYTFDGWYDDEGKKPEDYVTVPDKDLTFTAKWNINQYTITFADTGDSSIPAIKQNFGTAITAPADPTKTGYTFDSWDTEIPATMPAKDMTITAKWNVNQYTITFNADGGVADSTVTADYKSPVAAPAEPTKAGYTFKGWATTKGVTDASQAVTFPVEMPLNGTTYYAIWVVNEYTISFDTLGGTPAVDSVTADYLSAVAKPATEPTKTGYTFKGWSETSGSTAAVTFPYEMPLGGTTLYAIWQINTYTVTWDNEGDKSTVDYDYNEVIVLPTEPTKTGYSFGGWNGYTEGMKMPAEDVTFTAVWTANNYPATFNANYGAFADGEKSKTIQVAYDSNIVFAEEPVRAGYEFNGWTPAVGKMDDVNGKTFEATWLADTDITYTIETYIMDTTGAYGEPTTDKKAGTTDASVSTTHETKEGFTPDLGKSVLTGVVAADGSTTLKVYYIRNQYAFITDVDGATTSTNYYYEATVAAPADPEKTGYTFASWNPAVPATMPANDVTVTATWTINKHDVIYMVDGVQYSKVEDVEFGTLVTPIAAPVQEGYTFSGWDKAEAFNMPDADVTISGTFTANEYTITFDSNGGSAVGSITQAYKSAVTAPADPTRDGYTFAGWEDADGNKVSVPATMPLGGAALNATWTAIDYTVTYYVDDTKTEVAYTRTAAYESNYNVPTPTKEGHTFVAWMNADGTESGLNPTDVTTIPLKGAEYYATWTVNSYELVYRTNGGTFSDGKNVKTFMIPYGTAKADWDVAETPNNPGYTWEGWNTATAPATMPAERVTITGKWTQEFYTVTFVDSLSDEVYSEESLLAYGDPVTVIDNPEKEGYTFLYWADAEGNEVTPADTMDDIGANGAVLTYTAIWDANEYTITFVTDGTPVAAITQDYGTPITADTTTTKAGYTFAGWKNEAGKIVEVPATMPAGNMTLTATWNANEGIAYTVKTFVMNSDGATYAESEETLYGKAGETATAATPDKEGFTFNAEKSTISGTIAGDGSLVLEVYYDRNKISVDVNGDKDDYYYDDEITEPTIPVDPNGGEFDGWEDEDGDPVDFPYNVPDEDDKEIIITPVYNYTVVYKSDDTEIYSIKDRAGTTYTVPSTGKTGYTFNGWTLDGADAGLTVGGEASIPVGGATYIASWLANEGIAYTVKTFVMNSDGATYAESEETLYGKAGETATAATPDKEGFTFNAEKSNISGTIAGDGSLVLEVYYDRNKISVDVNGDKDDYYYDDEITEPTIPVDPNGGEFDGWEDEDGDPVDFPYNVPDEDDKEIIITPVYNYTVVYTSDNAEVYSIKDRAGTTYTVPAASKTGYTFAGWTLDGADAGLTVGGEASIPVGGATYVAAWTGNEGIAYTVKTFVMNSDGATYAESEETLYGKAGETATAATPDKEGFTFNAEKSTISDIIAGDGSLVLEVYYDRNKISVDVNGDKDDYYYDDEITEPTIPVDPNGGEFGGWEDEDGDPVEFPYNVPDEEDKEIIITPVYNYTVVYTSDNAEVYSIKDRAGTTYTVPAATKAGYTFAGWTLDGADAGLTVGGEASIPVGGATYVATWTANEGIAYTVKTFLMNNDGVTYAESEETLYGKAGEPATAATPDKEGFTFNAEKSNISGTIAGDGSLVLEVYYDRNKITVDVNGEEDEYYYDDEITEPTIPVDPNGGEFGGWEDEDGDPVEFPYNVPDEEDKEIIITPVYNYTVVYVAEGTTIHTVKNRAGSDLEVPEAPAKEGYKFIKWIDADGETPADYATVPAKNVTFTALYEVSAYQVYYWVNNEVVSVKSAEYGETIVTGIEEGETKVNLLTYATEEGYVFDGWYTDAEMTTKLAKGATVGAARVDLYASETAGTYNAVFNVDGEEYAVVPTVFGEEIALPDEPTKEGFTFTGWNPAAQIMDAEGKTFEATWIETAGAYTATFKADGYKDEVFAMAFGDEFESPADPYKEGYTFGGWSDVEGGTTAVELPETMPAENLTYYAIFTVNNYTVNFNVNVETEESPFMKDELKVYETADYDFGEEIVMPADPTNIEADFYTFMGWTDVKGGTEAKYTAESVITMPAGDLELYAVYERVSVKLVPIAGSTTVIERNGVKESYSDDSVTTDPYATPANFNQYYIYGFTNKRSLPTEANLETRYITYTGDGRIEITRREGTEGFAKLGTGTLVTLYDNVTGEVVEQFYLIYFGDVDGDCYVTGADYTNVNAELSKGRTWSALRGSSRVLYMIKAANLDGQNNIYGTDLNLLNSAVNGKALDQTTGVMA